MSLFATPESVWIPTWKTKHYLIVSLLIALISIVGEYLEGFLKTVANVNDAEEEEGGTEDLRDDLLDRLDSLVLTANIVYLYSKLVLKMNYA